MAAAKADRPGKTDLLDVFNALRAINAAPGLSAAGIRVGWALLEHLNKTTGRCDPSIERISRMLGLNEKTVRRATEDLCDLGLFEKRSHGGNAGRASYTPKWAVLKSILDAWHNQFRTGDGSDQDEENRARMSGSSRGLNRAKMSGSAGALAEPEPDIPVQTTGQECPVEPDKNVRQTYYNKPTIEPIAQAATAERAAARDLDHQNSGQKSHRLLNEEVSATRPPGYQARERSAPKGCSRSDAAWLAATRRLDDEIAKSSADWRSDMWVLTDEVDRDHAIRAELTRRGEGIIMLWAAVERRRREQGGSGHG